jgi:hypothetical protein
MPQDSAQESRKPVDKFTDGHDHVSIWENSGVKARSEQRFFSFATTMETTNGKGATALERPILSRPKMRRGKPAPELKTGRNYISLKKGRNPPPEFAVTHHTL